MLKIGDKIRYVKVNSLIDIPLGTTMDIVGIENNWVMVNSEYTINGRIIGYIQGAMTCDEIEKYFEKVIEPEKSKRVWTEWKPIGNKCEDAITNCGKTHCEHCEYDSVCSKLYEVEYRTNGKKVMVRYKIDGKKYIKAEATCYKTDTFNLIKGLKIACGRLGVKIAKYNVEQIIKEIG